jgi:hypothetical protein
VSAALIVLLACGAAPSEDSGPLETVTTAPTLPLPDIEGVPWDAVFTDALALAVSIDARAPWSAHEAALALGAPGCPDLYLGPPDDPLADAGDGGVSWSDACAAQSASFSGWAWWTAEVLVTGDASTPEGATTTASRSMSADAAATSGDALLLELDGTVDDALNRTVAPGYDHWTYTSTVDATLGGALGWGPDAAIPGGLRTDLYLFATGGDVDALEVRGNVYLPEHRLHDRFDSLAVDAAFTGARGAAADACTLEPAGTLSVRDADAFWYDVVFQPRYEDDAADTGGADPGGYGACDGCGTLYIRGVEQPQLVVCPDFDGLWSWLTPPDPAEYVPAGRDVTEEGS